MDSLRELLLKSFESIDLDANDFIEKNPHRDANTGKIKKMPREDVITRKMKENLIKNSEFYLARDQFRVGEIIKNSSRKKYDLACNEKEGRFVFEAKHVTTTQIMTGLAWSGDVSKNFDLTALEKDIHKLQLATCTQGFRRFFACYISWVISNTTSLQKKPYLNDGRDVFSFLDDLVLSIRKKVKEKSKGVMDVSISFCYLKSEDGSEVIIILILCEINDLNG